MLKTLSSLHPFPVIGIAVIGFLLGYIWYSLLFGKAWRAEMKIDPAQPKPKGMGTAMVGAFLLTIVTTVTLAGVIANRHTLGLKHGAEIGLFFSVGLIASRQATSALFEKRSLRHFLIVTGHDVVLCALVGALLGRYR
jgi:hypothetical protein